MAELAENVAAYFEKNATRGDSELRLAIARTEHEVARIERQNAERLRNLSTRYERGDRPPTFPRCASDTAD
jgi:hypothetical protein